MPPKFELIINSGCKPLLKRSAGLSFVDTYFQVLLSVKDWIFTVLLQTNAIRKLFDLFNQQSTIFGPAHYVQL